MKKKFVKGRKVSGLIVTFVSLLVLLQNTQNVYASAEKKAEAAAAGEDVPEGVEAENRLMKVIPLDADTVTQIPKYIVEENITYVLDESSVVVEETESGTSEGANVITVSRKVEDLPDNDLERIRKTVQHEGITCELLSVIYEVEKEDEYGIPTGYSAVCEYGGLKKYSTSYPTAWQMTAWYDICETTDETVIVTGREEYEYVHVPAKAEAGEEQGRVETEMTGEAGMQEKEEPFPEPEVKKISIKQTPGEEDRKKIADIPVPLAAAASGIGAVLPFIVWFSIVTVPIFTLKKEERYRYIGRIRLKKEEGMYTACLTKRLIARAEIPVFMIKLPEKIRKKTKAGMLQICCPDGKRILLTAGKEVHFTVEGEEL